jgi:hypothetical protein
MKLLFASAFLVALQIAMKSVYAQVNFESDRQTVVNAITNIDAYVNELSAILTSSRSFISSNASYNLARASIFQSNPNIFYYFSSLY